MSSSGSLSMALDHEEIDSQLDTGGIGGHPAGLTVLFFTEMWERFSYYGMRAILILYMVALPLEGGLGFDMKKASAIYGFYTMSVYLGCIPGGFIADRFLGQKRSILIGGSIIALGHFTLAFKTMETFYGGLALIILGTGLLKPNMSTLVGKLYSKNDHRRDGGFSIYYMGINIGAAISPIVCGFLAQANEFKGWLKSMNLDPLDSWHWGFAAAGVGMTLGLLHFLVQQKSIANVGNVPQKEKSQQESEAPLDQKSEKSSGGLLFSKVEWMKLGALGILFVFTILFWAVFEQGGSSLNVFADKLTDCSIFGHQFPSSWFQSVQAIFVIVLAPIFSWLWIKLGDKEPSSPAKFAYGLALLAAGIGIMVPASMLAAQHKVGLFWLSACYFLQTLGELCLSPVGLSTVTKLAPRRIAAMTMGIWFLGPSFGNYFAGQMAGFFNEKDINSLVYLYGGMAGLCLSAVVILVLLTGQVRKLMVDVK
ncbi:MAG: peptide MFS transporter [Candidatus Obscuribacterales bacterium]|nr:peptide MFS transporter [Candidatus Obscuribacterales bacterium]